MPLNLPTNLLRSFVAIVDAGSMMGASSRVFVTQSALSLQIRRLEDLVARPLFARDGRRLALTPEGEVLLDYARRILNLHDEAVAAVTSGAFLGPLRVGMVQDFADALFSGVLANFAKLHPDTQVYARVAGTAELLGLVERGEVDVAVGFSAPADPLAVRLSATAWFGDRALADLAVIPLAVLETPCRFRQAAIDALEAQGKRYRIAVETPNLSTLRAAVNANLGVTCRALLFDLNMPRIPANVLPDVADVACIVAAGKAPSDAAAHFFELVVRVVVGATNGDRR